MRIIRVSTTEENGAYVEERNDQAGGMFVRILEVIADGEPGQAMSDTWNSLPMTGEYWVIHEGQTVVNR